jgi:hypothetical protein
LKGLHSSDYLSGIVSKNSRRNSDRNAFACLTENMGCGVENRFAARNCAPQEAGIFTDVRSKNITALPAHCFPAVHFRDLLCSPIESSNSPLQIDGENPLVDRI